MLVKVLDALSQLKLQKQISSDSYQYDFTRSLDKQNLSIATSLKLANRDHLNEVTP